jgi:hypothetical protein
MKGLLAALPVALVLGASAGQAAPSRPALSVVDREPVTIALRGFKSRELVKVVLLQESRLTRRVLTTLSGVERWRGSAMRQRRRASRYAQARSGTRAAELGSFRSIPAVRR